MKLCTLIPQERSCVGAEPGGVLANPSFSGSLELLLGGMEGVILETAFEFAAEPQRLGV